MNTRFARFSAVMLVAALSAAASAADPVGPSVAIGRINPQSGRAELFEPMLKHTFQDGGPIRQLLAMPFQDGYNLLRVGKDADGHCRTETLRLEVDDGRLKLRAVRWFTTCSSSTCDANNEQTQLPVVPGSDDDRTTFAMCIPNHAKTACDCIGENGTSNCNFGIDVGGMGLETVLVQMP